MNDNDIIPADVDRHRTRAALLAALAEAGADYVPLASLCGSGVSLRPTTAYLDAVWLLAEAGEEAARRWLPTARPDQWDRILDGQLDWSKEPLADEVARVIDPAVPALDFWAAVRAAAFPDSDLTAADLAHPMFAHHFWEAVEDAVILDYRAATGELPEGIG